MKKWLIYLGIALGLTMAIACGNPSDDDDDGDDFANTSGSAAPVAAKKNAGFNTPVRDGKFEFVVKKMTCDVDKVGTGLFAKKAAGDYCLVNLTITNIGDEAQMFFDGEQKGIIGKKVYSSSSEAAITHSGADAAWLKDINPGTTINATVVFDTPSDAKLRQIVLHDSMFSGGVTVDLK